MRLTVPATTIPRLPAKATRKARRRIAWGAILQQVGAACLAATTSASIVIVAANNSDSRPADGDGSGSSAYRQVRSSFVDRWGEVEYASLLTEELASTPFTKSIRTVVFAKPVQEPSQEDDAAENTAAIPAVSARPRFPVAYSLASIDPKVEIEKPADIIRRSEADGLDEVSQYLWEVYKREPTKKDGSGDFTWKDPAAAKRVGMPLAKYVIGGMHPDFREQLYHAGRAMDQAGIKWSILSAFRDDYRQRIASGIKAGARNSLHGGSARTGGYGNGRAVDVTNADGEASDVWKWFDANGAKYGLTRPMPGYDPAHIQAGGDWRKVGASLRKARIKAAAEARAPSTTQEARADVVASAPAQADRSD